MNIQIAKLILVGAISLAFVNLTYFCIINYQV